MHGAPDVNHWHLTTFESHDPASMGKLLIPGDIIMYAFMAIDGHGCWMLDAGYSMLDTRCSILDSRCSMLDTGYSMLDT